jgi:PAS domain S-box-containing protein
MEKAEEQPRSAHSIEVPSEIIGKWQEFVNLLAEIMHVPSASIMRAEPPHIRIFVSSTSEGNPCEPGALDTGPYCETVMKTGQPLLVPDALENEAWKANPHIRLGMISYLGVPISWPDGRIFGTICVRDNKKNEYSEAYLKLLLHFRDMLQVDLKSLARLHGEIEERETKIRRLVDANIIGIFIWDFDGRILEANKAFLDIVEYDHDDLVAGSIRWTDLTPPEWRDRDARLIQEHLKNGSLPPFEKEYFRKDGSRVPVLIGVATFEEGGTQGVAFVLDLTERKRAEEALRKSEARFRDYAETASDWYWETDPDHKFTRVTDYERLLARGFAPVSRIGLTRWEFATDVEAKPEKWELHRSMLEARQPFRDFVYPAARTDGSPVYYKISGKPVFDASGEFRGYRGTGSDVTAITRAQEALRESERSARSAIDGIAGLVAIIAPNGELDALNRQVIDYFGRSLEEMKNWGTSDAIHPEDLSRIAEIFQTSIATGTPFHYELRLRRFDGEYRWFDNRCVPIRDESGHIARWYMLGTDIEDRKRAEAALRESEKNLQTIIDTIPGYVVRYRPDGTADFVNQTLRKFVGLDVRPDEMNRTVHPDDHSQALLKWQTHVAAGEPCELEMRMRRAADGVYRWQRTRRVPLRDANGAIVNWYGAGHDIDDQKRAEDALRESQKSLQTIVDTIPALVVRYRADGTPDFVNQTARKFLGPEVGLDEMPRTIHPEDVRQTLPEWRRHIAAGEPYENEMRLRRADGMYRWHRVTRVPLRDANGAIVNWYGAGHDIDDKKRAEQALRASEARLAEAQRLSHTGSWAIDPAARRVLYWSEESYRIWGFDPVQGPPYRAIVLQRIHPADRDRVYNETQEALLQKRDYRIEFRIVLPDGAVKYLEAVGHHRFSASGEVVEIVGTNVDVTERKRAEQALRESEAQLAAAQRELQAMIDTIPAMVASYDAKGSLTYVNKTALDYSGLPAAQAISDRERMDRIVHPDELDQVRSQWRASVANGEPFQAEMRLRRRDGEYRWVSTCRVPLRDSTGKVVKWYGAAIDIEDRKRAEQALHRSEAYLAEAQRLTHCGVTAFKGATVFYGSDEIYRIWGFDPAQGVPSRKEVIKRVHPDDRDRLNAEVERALAEKRPYSLAYRIVLPDGTVKHLESIGQPVFSANGELVEVVATQVDVTERKRAELALREREAQLVESRRELVETIDTIQIPVGRYSVDAVSGNTRRDFVNAAWKQYTGLTDEAALGSEWSIVIDPDQIAPIEKMWREALAKGEPLHTEERVRRFDGQYRWFAIDRVAVRDENGKVIRWYGTAYDIEDRKQAEDLLRRNEAYLAEAQRLTHCGVSAYKETTILYWSEETYRIWGFDPAQGVPTREAVFQRIHSDDRDQVRANSRRLFGEKRGYSGEFRIILPDGTAKYLESISTPVFSANGEIVEAVATHVDVTERKRAELALRRNEAELIEAKRELQQTIDIIPLQVVRYSSDFKREFVNAAWKQFTGASDEAAHGTKWATTVHPDDLAVAEKGWGDAALAKGEPVQAELRLCRGDGQYRWFSVYRVALRDENGKVTKWYSTGYDIEERKRAEDALRRSEAHLAEAQQLSHTGAVRYNGTAILYASEETFRIWGFDPAQGLPSRDVVFQRIHPGDRYSLDAEVRRAVSERKRFSIGYRIVMPDGTVKHLDTIGQPVFSASGKLLEIVATQTDVTDRKRAEDALRRSEAYLAEAQRLSVTGSFGWRIADNVIVWSQETYRIFEVDPAVTPTLELVLGRTHPDDIELVRSTIERMANEDREFDFEHRLLLPDGAIKHLHVRTRRGRFERGEVEVFGALRDVTAAREAEEALRRAQAELAHAARVATLGELSASIAHEVNQPLASIVASGEAAIRWLDRDVPEKERAHRAIMRLLNEAQRAGQVIRRIRELVKKAEPEMAQVDINSLVEDVVTLVHREAVGQRVAMQTHLASELPPVWGDRIQLQQVLINLVINGVQAMASVTGRARVLVIRTQRYGDDELLVAVEDAGIGIAPENLDRLFGAFYTTKPDGMGMGLSISRSIMEAHGGRVWATRNNGPGMTFQFTLSEYREQAVA